MLDLTTGETVVRSQYKLLPMSDLVISRVNELYRTDEGPTRPNPGANAPIAGAQVAAESDPVTDGATNPLDPADTEQTVVVEAEETTDVQLEQALNELAHDLDDDASKTRIEKKSARIAADVKRPTLV